MKKLLYISANSKEEENSSCKTVARKLINKLMDREEEHIEVEEVDVYKDHIPKLTHEYFCGRNTLCLEEDYEELNHRARNEIDRIKSLANSFKDADIYVVAAPMWSLFFPAPLKQYFDCVIQNGITIKISEKKCEGLLNDRDRSFFFVQSSGGSIPVLFKGMLDHGSAYLKDITKVMGINRYKEILVDGTGFTEDDRLDAVEAAEEEIDCMFKMEKMMEKAYKHCRKVEDEERHFVYRVNYDKDDENLKEEKKKEEEKTNENNEGKSDKQYSEPNNEQEEEIEKEGIKENSKELEEENKDETMTEEEGSKSHGEETMSPDKIEAYENMERESEEESKDTGKDYN